MSDQLDVFLQNGKMQFINAKSRSCKRTILKGWSKQKKYAESRSFHAYMRNNELGKKVTPSTSLPIEF